MRAIVIFTFVCISMVVWASATPVDIEDDQQNVVREKRNFGGFGGGFGRPGFGGFGRPGFGGFGRPGFGGFGRPGFGGFGGPGFGGFGRPRFGFGRPFGGFGGPGFFG